MPNYIGNVIRWQEEIEPFEIRELDGSNEKRRGRRFYFESAEKTEAEKAFERYAASIGVHGEILVETTVDTNPEEYARLPWTDEKQAEPALAANPATETG